MRAEIRDEFDPDKIIRSGQCFRSRKLDDGTWMFLSTDRMLRMKREGGTDPMPAVYEISCTPQEWSGFWSGYFDLSRNYAQIRQICLEIIDDRTDTAAASFLRNAAAEGCGLRILRQDPWEMLITFILSQRKNMPAIALSVEKLCRAYGHEIKAEGIYDLPSAVFSFPSPDELSCASEPDLRALGLGYRAPYVTDAAQKVCSGALDLQQAGSLDDEALYQTLMTVKGVGKKVADCICLFGYGRLARVPVDVWISRAVTCCGGNPFPAFGPYAGIMQQYVFYAMTK